MLHFIVPDCPHCGGPGTDDPDLVEHADGSLFHTTCPDCGGGYRFDVIGSPQRDDVEVSAATATTEPNVTDVLVLVHLLRDELAETRVASIVLRRGLEDLTRRATHHANTGV